MSIDLTSAERELLLNLLNDRLGELRQEIHHSMVSKFTDELKQSKEVLQGLIAKFEEHAPVS